MQYFAYSQKAFVYKYVVMLSDVDQFKHMSFANYLKLMFLATDALFVTFFDEENLNRYQLKLLDARMQFKRQTVSGDNILIKVNSSELVENRFTLLYTFVTENGGELVALSRQLYSVTNLQRVASEIPTGLKNILGPIAVEEKYLLYKY